MRPGRMIGALVGLGLMGLGTASCVSILGVDAAEYEDIDETICSCVDGGDALRGACEEVVQGLVEGENALQKANACVAESATCDELEECLAGGACLALEQRCAKVGDGFQLRCCNDLECVDGACVSPNTECVAPEITCGAACCGPQQLCVDGGCVACASPNGECGDGRPCCTGSCASGLCTVD